MKKQVSTTRICKKCRRTKALEEFAKSQGGHRRHVCKECYAAYHRWWRGSSPLVVARMTKEDAGASMVCRRCHETKPESDFLRHPNSVGGRDTVCKECRRSYLRSYGLRPDVIQRRLQLGPFRRIKNKYGLTDAECTNLMTAQACEICGESFSASRHRCVDHDHSSGKVRGALCNACNALLGFCRESPAILRAAELYLEKFKTLQLSQNSITGNTLGLETTPRAPEAVPDG